MVDDCSRTAGNRGKPSSQWSRAWCREGFEVRDLTGG